MDYEKNNRILARQGQRGTFGTVLHELAKTNSKVVAVTADLTRVSGLERFFRDYPERALNIGIDEQNLVAFAAGVADEGYIPFATTFANFAALRANEFVRHFMAYMKCNVKLVGLGSGFSMELFGNTHYGIEDIAVLRSMPNIVILSPSDCMEVGKCVEYCATYEGPVYLRLSGKSNYPTPIVNKDDYLLEVGKARPLIKGEKAIIYATGSMVEVALRASMELEKRGIDVAAVNIHTIKPFDAEFVENNRYYPLILTLEEHSVFGGLGTSVAEVLARYDKHGKLICMGIQQGYKKAGDYDYMLEQNGLIVENVVTTICQNIK